MFSALPTARQNDAAPVSQAPSEAGAARTPSKPASGWKSTSGSTACCAASDNVSPTFRFPDLISACVSLVFVQDDAPARIFDFLGTQLVLRPPLTPRRRESMWRPQYDLLLAVQRSPANRHPNPKFQLDQLTTACVALCRQFERRRRARAAAGTPEHGRSRRAMSPASPRVKWLVPATADDPSSLPDLTLPAS